MTTVTISLPDALKTFIDSQLATKGYGNVGEYFRSLLRDAQAKEEEAHLETLLLSRFRLLDQRTSSAVCCWRRFDWVRHGWKISGCGERRTARCFNGSCGVA